MSETQKHTKPNVPNLRFPGFEGEWECRKIGEDCSVLMCKRIFANQTSEQGEVPFYKIGTIGAEPDAYISRELFEEYKAKYNYPRKGEVMVTCAGTVGKTIVFNGEDSYYQDSNIVWLSNPKQLYVNSFLNYFLSRVNWNKLNSTTITRIYNDNLRELVIKYPSVKEQEKIVSLLSLLDQRIAVQSKVIEDLKKLKTALNDKLHQQVVNGQTFSFSEIGDSYSGLSGKGSEDFGDGAPFVTYTNIYTNDVVDENDYGYVRINDGESQNQVRYGDLLFTLSSETPDEVGVGSVYLGSSKELYLNSFSFGIHIRRTDVIFPPYLAHLVSSRKFRRFIYPFAQGSTRYNLQKHDFETTKYSFPIYEDQVKICSVLDSIAKKIAYENDLLRSWSNMKQYLLYQLFI